MTQRDGACARRLALFRHLTVLASLAMPAQDCILPTLSTLRQQGRAHIADSTRSHKVTLFCYILTPLCKDTINSQAKCGHSALLKPCHSQSSQYHCYLQHQPHRQPAQSHQSNLACPPLPQRHESAHPQCPALRAALRSVPRARRLRAAQRASPRRQGRGRRSRGAQRARRLWPRGGRLRARRRRRHRSRPADHRLHHLREITAATHGLHCDRTPLHYACRSPCMCPCTHTRTHTHTHTCTVRRYKPNTHVPLLSLNADVATW